ncbi:MAG: hypothetical protein K2H38_08860 [Muribaculaceae bacterium]|nr:hypothetical protein [Muribaculaceae bacterium]
MTSREFDIFFRRMYLPLGMFALRIVDDAQSAEDIVEDCFAKAWQMTVGLSEPVWGYSNVSTGAGVVAAQSPATVKIDLSDFLLKALENPDI